LNRTGAITAPALERIAREYLAVLRRAAPAAERVTDKMPVNFLHLGLIALLFPGARVVHCIRDPRDTCLSCHFNLPGDNAHYSDDLATLGRFYRQYERLMAHWKAVLDMPILDVVYEDLVADIEGGSRRLVGFAGLDWDPACLAFHENARIARTASLDQVRKPVYTGSVGRWKRYEAHLGPLLRGLGPAVPG
jgi:hypothetical protein